MPLLAGQERETQCLSVECTSGWGRINFPNSDETIAALAVRSPSLIIAGNDSGIWRTNFSYGYSNLNWLHLSSMPVTCLAIYVDSTGIDTTVYAGTNGSGLFKIKMYPFSSPIKPADGLTGVLPSVVSFLWQTSTPPYDLQISSDSTFNTFMVSLSGIESNSFTLSSGLSPSTTYYWHVLNGDSAWSEVWSFTTACSACSPNTPDSVVIAKMSLANLYVKALTVDSRGTLYAISSAALNGDYIITRTVDSGSTWTGIPKPSISITALAIDSSDNLLVTTDKKIFRSINGVWNVRGTQPPDSQISSVAIGYGDIFIGTDDGAYFSRDTGMTWNPLGGPGLPSHITALGIGSPGAMMPVVGSDSGLYEYLASTPIVPKARHASALTFSGQRLIFSVSTRELVDVRAYDARGVERMQLFHGELASGMHEISLGTLSNGIYFCRLKIGQDTIETLRIMFVQARL
jgi:hypothetical protein